MRRRPRPAQDSRPVKKIHALTTRNNPNSDSFNFPLRVHRQLLRAFDLDVVLFFDLDESLYECDLLFVNSKFFRPRWRERPQEVIEFLCNARERLGSLLWFDTTDSTGTTSFQILPYVDGYYKAQVLVEKDRYLEAHYGQRVFTDFYHREYGITDEDTSYFQVLPTREDLPKIHNSWNSALGNHGYGVRSLIHEKAMSYLLMRPRYTVTFTPPEKERNVEISCRLGRGHIRNTVRFQRDRVAEVLETDYGVSTNKLPKRRYWRELQDAKIVASPFGWGEITLRDFHAFINGAALLKPDMSHLLTWPPLYVEGETYVAHGWEMLDLEERVELLRSRRHYTEIARNAQALYGKYLFTREGHVEFCERIKGIVERHLASSAASPSPAA